MQDAFAYCAALVRTADKDRFVASLFAPAERRDALAALYAFNVELARVREVAHAPLPGEIRLQWWREVLEGERAGEAKANPVAAALVAVVERHGLAASRLKAMVDARRFDLYDAPMARLTDLEDYARDTAAAPMRLAAQILAGVEASAAVDAAATALVIADVLRALPRHAARRQLYVPAELLARHGVAPQEVFARQSSAGLKAALAELAAAARRNLDLARERLAALPPAALPAVLPVAPVRAALDRLVRGDPFAPVDLPPWRRQWLIWLAARNPARLFAR